MDSTPRVDGRVDAESRRGESTTEDRRGDSAPEPVVRSLGVPARRWREPLGIAGVEERIAGVPIEIRETEARRFGNRDRAVLDERPRKARDEAAPLRDVGRVILEGEEVFGRSSGMDTG